jgi:ABC-type transport system involved in multi-copper enzyme maturation permease subunit
MKKQVVVTPKIELEFDATTSKQLVGYLRVQDGKLQGMLLWCSIVVLTGYIAVIFAILQLYATLPGHHTGCLAIALVLICLLLAAFLWLQFRISAYKPTRTQIPLKEFCYFKKKQIKMLSAYLVTYALIVFASCVACWLEAGDDGGAEKLFRITTPVSILIYITGLYLLAKLGARWHSLNEDIRSIDRELIRGFYQQ